MSRLTDHNVALAREIIVRYPRKKSALIPLVHLSQEQNGYVTDDAMRHIAELIDVTPAEVYGTATFYEMFRFEPLGAQKPGKKFEQYQTRGLHEHHQPFQRNDHRITNDKQ